AEPSPVFVEFGAEIEEVDLGEITTLVPFIDADLGIDSIIWSPTTGLTCIDTMASLLNCSAVSVNPDGTTTYSITVIDSNGCEATDEIIIDVNKRRNVYIPNAFSPDGNGRNDYFEIFLGNGIKAVPSAYVFNRWGETIVELTDIPVNGGAIQIWDGFFRGKLMNPGVFVYLIEVTFVDDVTLPFRGDVTVIR
ncbi:MAG: hypothetical protein HKN16_11370, partial [Saprospiraceae bacterium]|nr:hypothetical protein [Saprospiraceae bacterium]